MGLLVTARSSADPDSPRLLIRNLAQVATPFPRGAPLRGRQLKEIDVTPDAYILCDGGRITAVGSAKRLPALRGEIEELDAAGACAVPGLVDCHTHAGFGGDRVDEFALRAGGATYEELHAAGGGILSTVRATRVAGADGIADALARHVRWLVRAGTTTFEAKSGYGLDRDTELACLRAIAAAGGVPTWLGGHAVPPEFEDGDAYLDYALHEVLPAAAAVAEAADVFVETGGFTVEQGRRYLAACAAYGLTLRLHADQFAECGAVSLAIELGARSVDHLEATGAEGVRQLAASSVVAVLLPAALPAGEREQLYRVTRRITNRGPR